MIHYIYGDDLDPKSRLARSMFRDRARQLKDRLDWAVDVDADGLERDEYDDMNPLYVVWENADGTHGGSLRFMPTTGETMLNDHFQHVTGTRIESPVIWECTRLCLSPGAPARVSSALFMAGCEVIDQFYLDSFVAVFNTHTMRIWKIIGGTPEVLGTCGEGKNAISVGLWYNDPDTYARLSRRAGITAEQSRAWFERAFGPNEFKADLALTA